jgi:hypothetical protein
LLAGSIVLLGGFDAALAICAKTIAGNNVLAMLRRRTRVSACGITPASLPNFIPEPEYDAISLFHF